MEIYVVMNSGREADDLIGVGMLPSDVAVEELGTLGEGGGERTFLVSRSLKRD